MWSWLWRSRDRFTLDKLSYLIDQLRKIRIVNNVNKDFVIESLRSIAELIIYGDQHDPSFFEQFTEKQVMGEFVRILNISKTLPVSVQLLQTMSIIIQNLKSEHAIYYLFSNEHLNSLIICKYEFLNEELLSYYISFLRAISGKLNNKTISLFLKMNEGTLVSFALYDEAIRFAFNEESMIRTAVRTLTLNIYHVGDKSVNRYVAAHPRSSYFSDFVEFFKKQCLSLNTLVIECVESTGSNAAKAIYAAVDEIEDHLYYFSDAVSADIPDLERLLTDFLLQLLIFPLLLPSLCLKIQENIGAIVSMFLLCCILRIVKYKDLANTIAATMFCRLEALCPDSELKLNSFYSALASSNSSPDGLEALHDKSGCAVVVRDILLFYINNGSEQEVSGSINLLATLLQTKELEETMLDALGILPRRKQHKKMLLETLVGEGPGEVELISAETDTLRDAFSDELDNQLQNIKDKYEIMHSSLEIGTNHRALRLQVVDVLINLMSRTNLLAQTLWDGGWLLRQLLPYKQPQFPSRTLKLLMDLRQKYAEDLLLEIQGDWPDLLIPVLSDEWKKCKLAIEASSFRKDPKAIILPPLSSRIEVAGEISYLSGEKMHEVVKRFVLLQQLCTFSSGGLSPEKPPITHSEPRNEFSRAKIAGLDLSNPKPGNEVKLVHAIPCRISFERGKERHLFFLATSDGSSGCMILAQESPSKERHGTIRIVVPLCGSSPTVDEKHPKWLHLRVRLSSLPLKNSQKALVDGRWTLAFRDEESCKSAVALIEEEIRLLRKDVQRRIAPLVDLCE